MEGRAEHEPQRDWDKKCEETKKHWAQDEKVSKGLLEGKHILKIGKKAIVEDTVTKNFPKFMKHISWQI